MSNKNIVFNVIGVLAGMTAVFVAGRKSAEKQIQDICDRAVRDVDYAKEELDWLSYELEERNNDNNFLREQLAEANEEINNLRKSGKNSK